MPIINRPRTDAERLNALSAAKSKYDAVVAAGGLPAFSSDTYARLDAFANPFITEMNERGAALSGQTSASAAANPARSNVRIFVSHFIQVFNLGVARGVYPASARGFYNLAVSSEKVPALTTDEDLVQWATNVSNGDAARVAAGGAAMSNPTAAEVDAQLAVLQPLLASLTTAKDAYDAEQEGVAALRPEADDIIADVWDEVLFAFRKDDAPSMRRKAREYGVVYRVSKGEEPLPDEYSAKGIATDGAGVPLMDVEVTDVTTNITVFTDEEGRYLMPKLDAGNRSFLYKKDGYQDQMIPVTVTDDAIAVADVVMEMI